MVRRKLTKERVSTVSRFLLEAANVPFRYWDVKFKLIKDEEVRDTFRPLLVNVHEQMNAGKGYLLTGPAGSGKTSMSVLFAKEVMRRGGVVTFIPAAEFVEIMISQTRIPGQDETLVQRIRRSHLLVLDDLGAEVSGSTGNIMSMLENLVRRAYNSKVSLISTTNLLPKEMVSRYTPTFYSVLNRMCDVTPMVNKQWSD